MNLVYLLLHSETYAWFTFRHGRAVIKVKRRLKAQFHGSVLRPDLTQNSAKRVLKSNTPRKQFCLQCTFPRLVFARARGRIIMKFPTRAPRLKLLSRSFGQNKNISPCGEIFLNFISGRKNVSISGCKTEPWNCMQGYRGKF